MPHCTKHGDYLNRPQISTRTTTHEQKCPRCAVSTLKASQSQMETPTSKGALQAFVSKLPPKFKDASLENFTAPTNDHAFLLKVANRFVNSFSKEQPPGGMVIMGPTGTGKTHYSIALGREITSMGLTPHYTTVADMIKEVRASWGETGGESIVLSKLVHYDLMIIDEIGVQTGSPNEKQIICEVVDGRYKLMKPTILISNLAIDEVSKYVSERSVSRVLDKGMKLPFKVPSFRKVAA